MYDLRFHNSPNNVEITRPGQDLVYWKHTSNSMASSSAKVATTVQDTDTTVTDSTTTEVGKTSHVTSFNIYCSLIYKTN